MYKLSIDPEKWVDFGKLELEQNKPYWFKKASGKIVMGAPFSNGYSSGIADVCIDDGRLIIKSNTFHLVKGGQVQPVSADV